MENYFGVVDYLVVGGTLLFSLLIGVYYATCAKQATNEDLLVGGRNMGIMPIAASMLVTYLSAITVLGYPAEVYAHGIQIFMSTLTYVLVVPFSVYFFMTVFYKMQLTSVYEYLEYRFESVFVRWLASLIFIIQMAMFMGVCLFAPSIALSAFMGFKLWQSVIGLGLCATIYTSIGGLKAVVWTDVFQLFMIMGGMIAILIRGFVASDGIASAFSTAYEHGRLELFNFSIDPFMRHNTLNFFLGQGFTIFCLYGTHQPQVQRYCSLPSLRHAIKATIFAIPLNVFTVALCLVAGIVIFSSYSGCDPIAVGHIQRVDSIVPYFVIDKLNFLPGMLGLFTACVFSASLSTLSSGLNSLAAVTYEDFLIKIDYFKRMDSKAHANLVRILAVFYGVLSIALAFVAQNMGNILAATLTALGALSGPLGAVFAMGLLMPFINRYGALAGMTTGFIVMVWLTLNAFRMGVNHTPLPFTFDKCEDQNFTKIEQQAHKPQDLEWPEKLYTVSYIMYPFIGGVITFVVSTIVSVATGGFCSSSSVASDYLHPLVRGNREDSETKKRRMNNIDRIRQENNTKDGALQFSPTTPLSPDFGDATVLKPLLYRRPSLDKNV